MCVIELSIQDIAQKKQNSDRSLVDNTRLQLFTHQAHIKSNTLNTWTRYVRRYNLPRTQQN